MKDSLIYKMGWVPHPPPRADDDQGEESGPFLTSQALSQKGARLAPVQGFQPPPPLEWPIDFCGQDRLCAQV